MKIMKLSIFLLFCVSIILGKENTEKSKNDKEYTEMIIKKINQHRIQERYDLAKDIRKIKFPQDVTLSNMQEQKEIGNCEKCIKILKEYNRLTTGLLDNPYNFPEEIYNQIKANNQFYQENSCDIVLRKINFAEQLEKENQTTFDKILKIFKKIEQLTGLDHPFKYLR